MTLTGKILLAAVAVVGFSGCAMAADLSAEPAPAYQPPAAADWGGAYVGASVGYGWGTASDNGPASFGSSSTNGWLLGGQLGYNFHLADTLVAGVEGNIDWDNQSGTVNGISVQRNWDGSLRGRLGFDLDGILPYAEAGIAFANATDSVGGASASNTQTGWTAGGGIEFKLADQVSVNAEYRYSDYGSQNFGSESLGLTDSTVRTGLNYHF
ncbi:MAG TPA: outer membrane protein [Devosiaceae bacterium]|jgi:opacity protein-like surface antigen|nr:outer membrane protein [Devosiaceae bacterium]